MTVEIKRMKKKEAMTQKIIIENATDNIGDQGHQIRNNRTTTNNAGEQKQQRTFKPTNKEKKNEIT